MKKFLLLEVDKSDYLQSKGSQKIIGTLEPNYYYKLSINDSDYFIDANGDSERFLFKEIETDSLVFASEDRFYIFSLTNDQIKFAMRTFDPIVECRVVNDFILLFTERGLLKISKNSLILYSMDFFSDLIENIILDRNKLIVSCFDGRVFEIVI